MSRGVRAKPLPGAAIDRLHPSARGLLICIPLWEGQGKPREVAGQLRSLTVTGAPAWRATSEGWGRAYSGGAYDTLAESRLNPSNASNFTLMGWVIPYNVGQVSAEGLLSLGTTLNNINNKVVVQANYVANRFSYYLNTQLSLNGSFPILAGGLYQVTVTYQANVWNCYVNGQLDATGTANNNNGNSGTVWLGTGYPAQSAGMLAQVLGWTRALNPSEIRSLYADPFGLYQPSSPQRFFSVPRFRTILVGDSALLSETPWVKVAGSEVGALAEAHALKLPAVDGGILVEALAAAGVNASDSAQFLEAVYPVLLNSPDSGMIADALAALLFAGQDTAVLAEVLVSLGPNANDSAQVLDALARVQLDALDSATTTDALTALLLSNQDSTALAEVMAGLGLSPLDSAQLLEALAKAQLSGLDGATSAEAATTNLAASDWHTASDVLSAVQLTGTDLLFVVEAAGMLGLIGADTLHAAETLSQLVLLTGDSGQLFGELSGMSLLDGDWPLLDEAARMSLLQADASLLNQLDSLSLWGGDVSLLGESFRMTLSDGDSNFIVEAARMILVGADSQLLGESSSLLLSTADLHRLNEAAGEILHYLSDHGALIDSSLLGLQTQIDQSRLDESSAELRLWNGDAALLLELTLIAALVADADTIALGELATILGPDVWRKVVHAVSRIQRKETRSAAIRHKLQAEVEA